MKCSHCDKPLTQDEVKQCGDLCFDCSINQTVTNVAIHLRMSRVTFEEVIRKLLNEVDR